MATTRIKDLSKTATTVASDANIVIDGSSNGTQKIARDNFRQDTADAYVAAPSTYKLTPLNGVNKIDAAYLPTSGDTPKGEWNASTNSPTLADGTGTAGDYYDVTTAGVSLGISFSVGDVVKYDGANWFKIDSVANIFDGISTVDQVKTLAQVPNVGTAANEVSVNGMLGDLAFQSSAGVVVDDLTVDGHFTGAVGKPMPVNGPTMRFDGSNDFVSFAVSTTDSAFTYNNGTDDLPYSISGWIKVNSDATQLNVLTKWSGSTATSEWLFRLNDDKTLQLWLRGGTPYFYVSSANALTSYEGQWIHVSASYAGAGPNSATSFANAASAITLYINGKSIATTTTASGAYAGMVGSTQNVWIGRQGSAFSEGEIRDVKLFNKELSAAEVKEVYSNGQLPESFAESTGSASIYTGDSSTFAGGLGNWTEEGSTSLTVAASGGEMVVTNTSGASGGTKGARNLTDNVVEGKKLRLTFTSRCSSGTATGFTVKMFNGSQATSATKIQGSGTVSTGSSAIYSFTPTGSNETHIVEFVLAGAATDNLYFNLSADGTGEVYNFDNITLTQIGSVLDARAEQFDTSTGKLYDLSGNSFVGTQSGGVSLLGREMPIYQTGTWTPSITFGGGSTGVAYNNQYGHWARTGNMVTVQGFVYLSSKGSDTGTALINGLPYLVSSAGDAVASVVVGSAEVMTGLTSAITGRVVGSDIYLYDWGATGIATLTDANFGASALRFSATYQIQ